MRHPRIHRYESLLRACKIVLLKTDYQVRCVSTQIKVENSIWLGSYEVELQNTLAPVRAIPVLSICLHACGEVQDAIKIRL